MNHDYEYDIEVEEYIDGKYDKKAFVQHILKLSEATDYKTAVKEWRYYYMDNDGDIDYCPCGHLIMERCYIRNIVNNNITYVGNVCVKKFLGKQIPKVRDCVKRITGDITKNANEALIEHADESGYLFDGDAEFLRKYKHTQHKYIKSLNDKVYKTVINNRIIKQRVINGRSKT